MQNLPMLSEHSIVFLTSALVLGLLIGSFLNVVVYRLPIMMQRDWREQAREILQLPAEPEADTFNLVLPNSQCPHCDPCFCAASAQAVKRQLACATPPWS